MKKFYKISPFLLIIIVLLSVFHTTPVSAKPSLPPVINITIPAELPVITVGQTTIINITSDYSKSINWAVSTTLGTASINPIKTESGSHSTYLTVSSEIAGTGIVRITATDSNNKKIKSTKSINLEFVSGSDDLVYVALGDSIPYGYYNTSLLNYLSGGTDSYSYIEQLRDAMGILPANYYDESASGNNSIDVLNQLSNSAVKSLIIEADVITLCVGGNDIMDAVPRTISGLNKYNVNWALADEGRDNFETNWCQIIDDIEGLNPGVTLIIMTIYNPYRLTDSYYAQTNPYFEDSNKDNYGLNYIIRNTEMLYPGMLSEDFDYRVVDIYEAFNNAANKDSLTGFYNSFCDPHPNQAGHNLIFAEHYNIYN
jgi:lysophospholipase L1-like esterase